MLINYRAPALAVPRASWRRPYPSYAFRRAVRRGAGDPRGREAAGGSGEVQGQDRLHRPDGVGTARRVRHADVERAIGSMPGIQLHASMADSILAEPVHQARAPSDRGSAPIVIAALAIGLLSAFLPFSAAGRRLAGDPRRLDAGSRRARSGAASWLNMVQPLAVGGARAVLRHRLSVLHRGAREAEESRSCSAATCRATSTRSSSRNPDLAELGGKRREMTVLFSDIRGFTTVTERGQSRGARQPAERVFLADGRDRLPAQGNGRQVRRRHGHGAVRRAAGRPGARGPRGRRRPIDMVKELGELNRAWAGARA